MKLEKMTDEELERELSLCGSLHAARRIQSHIAALTMERDEAMERILATEEQKRTRHRDGEAELGDHLATRNSTGQRFDFPTALYMLKADVPVRRAGWNGKGMRLERVSPMSTADAPYLALIATDGKRYPWVPSQQDMFANDYEMVMP